MQNIQPSLTELSRLCAEPVTANAGIVVFGASGDLTARKLLPGLARLFQRNLLKEPFYVLGCGRKNLSDAEFRDIAGKSIGSSMQGRHSDDCFIGRLYYVSGDYGDPSFYETISRRLWQLNGQRTPNCRIFYLAVPPTLYGTITEGLSSAGLSQRGSADVRLVVEKPFGRDLQSAMELNGCIKTFFHESQIYRIDHYLGKETIQNIMVFRFANAIFEPIWNRNYIDHVQITIAESGGVGHRGGYYDSAGALRDMFQNHMLSMLALVAMEPPASFQAESVRNEKIKLLRSIRPLTARGYETNFVRGQYGPGRINGQTVDGYASEEAVAPDSRTETFVAAKLFIDNWRWAGVPFYLRTGKRLAARDTEIAITFRELPHSMFTSVGLSKMPANVLVLQIQPEEGISLSFQAKRPGSKICIGTLNMNFSYSDVFKVSMPDAYQRLLMDCIVGDQTLFVRQDDVELAWKLLDPVLKAWKELDLPPVIYPAGSESFAQADAIMTADGRSWRKLTQP